MYPYFRPHLYSDQSLEGELAVRSPVSFALQIATLLMPTMAGGLAAWGFALAMVEVGAAPPRTLTLVGHFVFASFGGIIGVLTGYATIRLYERAIGSRSRLLLLILATAFAAVAAAGMLVQASESVFYIIPQSVMDGLMRVVGP